MKQDPTTNRLPVSEVIGGFKQEDRDVLSAYGEFLIFRDRETVIYEKKTQDCLYFVIKGTLKAIHKVEGGGASPIGTIKTGEWFGEVNIFDPRAASAEVVAQVDTQVWRISRARLEEFLNDQPELGCALLLGVSYVLAHRTRELVAKLNATWEVSW